MAENLPDLQKSINLKQDKHKKYHINARLANCCNPMIKDQFLKAAREKKSICREKKKRISTDYLSERCKPLDN